VNERRDRDLKLNLYSRQGVQEYWIVDWREHLLEVYRRPEGELVLVATLRDGDVLATPLLPGFTCAVVSLWAPPLDR
jgi:Uma2 family endonuclease